MDNVGVIRLLLFNSFFLYFVILISTVDSHPDFEDFQPTSLVGLLLVFFLSKSWWVGLLVL